MGHVRRRLDRRHAHRRADPDWRLDRWLQSRPPMTLRHRYRMAAALLTLGAAATAEAHEKSVHQDMTTVAFEIMRLAQNDPKLLTTPAASFLPPGVTTADWDAFRSQIVDAGYVLRTLAPGFDAMNKTCRVTRNGFEQSVIVNTANWTQM